MRVITSQRVTLAYHKPIHTTVGVAHDQSSTINILIFTTLGDSKIC